MTQKLLNKETFERVITNIPNLELVAEFFMKSPTYIEKWCKENYDGHTYGEIKNAIWGAKKVALVEAQFKNAIDRGNPLMQIWLGKQYLGQTDKVENKVEVEPITFINDIGVEDEEN